MVRLCISLVVCVFVCVCVCVCVLEPLCVMSIISIQVVEASNVVLEVLDARDPLGCRCFEVMDQE